MTPRTDGQPPTPTLREAAERVLDRLDFGIAAGVFPNWSIDHGCSVCLPDEPMVDHVFKCDRHALRSALASPSPTWEEVARRIEGLSIEHRDDAYARGLLRAVSLVRSAGLGEPRGGRHADAAGQVMVQIDHGAWLATGAAAEVCAEMAREEATKGARQEAEHNLDGAILHNYSAASLRLAEKAIRALAAEPQAAL